MAWHGDRHVGARGGDRARHVPALQVDPVDTTGAWGESVQRAIKVAGRSTLHRDAQFDASACALRVTEVRTR